MINELKKGNQQPLYDLYRIYRNDFIRWAKHNFSCTETEAKDVFQETIIRFYENIMSGKLTELTCDVKTYLWTIGKFQLINLLKKNQRSVTFSSFDLINTEEPSEMSMDQKEEEKYNNEIIRQHLSKLDEKSRKLVEMYYLEGKDMKSIAKELGYKNADVAKKKKYEIMKKLASMVKNKLKMFLLM